jgi:general secretion pathway protein H
MTPNQRGFTLLELIVVIAVLGLLAGIVAARGPLRSDRLELNASARALANALELARSRAIASGRVIAVTTSASGFIVDERPFSLPAGGAMSRARVLFTPEGLSSGGTIILGSRSGRILISVNWLTGRVQRGPYQPVSTATGPF